MGEYEDQSEIDVAVVSPTLISSGPIEPGDIVFAVRNGAQEMLRLCGNGDILVKGRLAANDLEVVESFIEFWAMAKPNSNDQLNAKLKIATTQLNVIATDVSHFESGMLCASTAKDALEDMEKIK